MATTNNVRLNNLAAFSASSGFNWFWSLTRSIKKAGWKFSASSNGTTKISGGNPAADNWGAGVTSNAGAAAASIAAPTRGRATITGLTGIVAGDKGKFLLISGAATGANNNQHQIEEVLSATSVRIDARQFAVASDANNGSLTWSVRDPVADVFSSFSTPLETAISWWCAVGPSVLRIPFTVAATGTFIRGENITQATTGAEGELLGYIFSAGVGYLVVAPRLRGTGAGVFGWDTANVITGANSGATLTQNGTAIDYVYEVVISKQATSANIQILIGQFDTVAESAERFSFCATQAGCTATIHPGGGGTGNAFSSKAWVAWGTNSTAAAVAIPSASTFHRGHPICVDCIPEEDYSADGSWSLVYSGNTAGGNPTGFNVFGFHRLNDTEDGDLAPYVFFNPGGTKTLYAAVATNRLTGGTAPTIADSDWRPSIVSGTARVWFTGWRRRGLSGESYADLEPCYLHAIQSAAQVIAINALEVNRVVTSPDQTTRLREPIWLVSTLLGAKVFKGTLKWVYWFCGDQGTDVYGTDPAWVQISSVLVSAVIGPSDGTAWVLNG